MDKKTFETLDKLMGIIHYIYEDDDGDEEKQILTDIASIRAWMARIEQEITA